MTQVNLLPSDLRVRQRTRRATALVIAAAAAVVGLLVFVFVLQLSQLRTAEDELAAQQAENTRLQGQIAELQQFAQLQQQVSARRALVAEALTGRVLWSGVLRDLSLVIPGDMWLTGMTGQITDVTGTNGVATSDGLPLGSIQFQGVSFAQPTLARWLNRLEEVQGWVNPWVSSIAKSGSEGSRVEYQWSGSVDLSVDATVDGGQR